MKIDSADIEGLLSGGEPAGAEVRAVLDSALAIKGLSLDEAAILLRVSDPEALKEIYKRAGEVKQTVFGRRVVMFAPIYLSNYCTNDCVYCGFRSTLDGVERKALTIDEVVSEARALEEKGFKRVLLVLGEDKRWGLDYIISAVKAVYSETGIRIVHVNAPPMDVDDLRELKRSGVGVYQAFQETYHRPTYELCHPSGKKKDFDYRLDVMDRALNAGFNDVGIGSLLGLYDFRFDALATIAHSKYLYEEFNAHAHTISVPRLRPTAGNDDAPQGREPVTDDDMKLVTAVYRLAVPSAGVVVTTRESQSLRDSLMLMGASQLSAASRTDPGGYSKDNESVGLEQFSTNDHRSLEDVMASVVASGSMPSLCTACYRTGRVGEHFTHKTSSGEMGAICEANAVLTLKEYLLDGRANGCEELFKGAIDKAINKIDDSELKDGLKSKLAELEDGKRDIFF